MVLCKTPRVSVFGPHTRESLAEAKWTKVNKSGHYVWAPVNSCSLVSLCFKKRGGRCDHEESPCLFFSSHYRERGRRRWGGAGVWLSSSASPLPPLLLYPFQLSLPASCSSLSPPCPSLPLSSSLVLSLSSLLVLLLLAASLCPPSVPRTCRRGEINGVLGEGITQLNFDENRRKQEEGENKQRRGRHVKREREGRRIVYPSREKKEKGKKRRNERNVEKYVEEWMSVSMP